MPPAEPNWYADAIHGACAHVYRQQHHGRHEQDRADAERWLCDHGRQWDFRYRLTVPGEPVGKNRLFLARSSKALSAETRAFRRRVADAVILAGQPTTTGAGIVPRGTIQKGRWGIEIHSFWSRRWLQGGHQLAFADTDGPVAQVIDALQRANVIDNDMRFAPVIADKHVDKQNPRIEILIWENR